MEFIFHIDSHLNLVIQSFGNWSYLLLFGIIFAETGLVITPFLPGDSLLFAVGAFTAIGSFNLTLLFITLVAAAIIGDSVNYAFGKFFGEKILLKGAHRFFKKEHMDRTHRFYEKYGAKTIVLARFVPIVRTFAPFVAGVAKMSYRHFITYNLLGGVLWVSLFLFAGYFFGNLPLVKDNFHYVMVVIVLISVVPIALEWLKSRKG